MLRKRWKKLSREGFEAQMAAVLAQIRDCGPACSADVGKGEKRNSGGWWDWHPSKTALEYLWRSGKLTVVGRKGFQKYYDLSERVIEADILEQMPSEKQTIQWLFDAALDRLGFATAKELSAFWDTATTAEGRDWCAQALRNGEVIEVDVEDAQGGLRRHLMRPDTLDMLPHLAEPSQRMRVLSPFDPALRDRQRAERLFGFSYRIEIFVPEAKRQYGYYVFPVMQGDRIVGRIDMKADRIGDTLNVTAFWPELNVQWGKKRQGALEAELQRVARFSDVKNVAFSDGWFRPAIR